LHVDRERKDGCSNDGNVAPSWLEPSIVSLMLHRTAEGCCEMAFRGKTCEHYEVTGCEYVDPAGGGGGDSGGEEEDGEGLDCDLWHPGECFFLENPLFTCRETARSSASSMVSD